VNTVEVNFSSSIFADLFFSQQHTAPSEVRTVSSKVTAALSVLRVLGCFREMCVIYLGCVFHYLEHSADSGGENQDCTCVRCLSS
jgi:hypothetical protein